MSRARAAESHCGRWYPVPPSGSPRVIHSTSARHAGQLSVSSGGKVIAASSIAAIVLSRKLDLTKTYFIISGIAGVDPALGTLGSAHWARFAVDGGLQNEIEAREIPSDWTTGYLEIGAPAPGKKAKQARTST